MRLLCLAPLAALFLLLSVPLAARPADAAQPKSVVADRPFLFFITDLSSESTLFVGQVVEPELMQP